MPDADIIDGPADEASRRKSVLIVDDNLNNLQLLSKVIAQGGYHVRSALDGESALRSVEAKAPDLALLDIRMPGMDGFELCRRLKAGHGTRDIPVIFISALKEAPEVLNAFGLGGIDYITKPFEPDEVLIRIHTHIKLHEAQRQLASKNARLLDIEKDLRRRLGMEKLISSIAERLVGSDYENTDNEITSALETIGVLYDVDRCYLFQFSEDQKTMDNTHEWCAAGVQSFMGRLQGVETENFKFAMDKLLQGQPFHVPRVADLPPEARLEQVEFNHERIRSTINVPVMSDGVAKGFIGFDAVRQERAWLDSDFQMLRTAGGILIGFIQRSLAEKKIRNALEEKNTLLQEVHHRVKNNMQVISGLLQLQAGDLEKRKASKKMALEAIREGQRRIATMSLIHEKLYRSRNLTRIDMRSYASDLVQDLFSSFEAGRRGVAFRLGTEMVELGIDQAIPCGLILNELTSNCLKHAYPKNRKGTVTVSCRALPDGKTELTVEDDGIGFPDGFDPKSSDTLVP